MSPAVESAASREGRPSQAARKRCGWSGPKAAARPKSPLTSGNRARSKAEQQHHDTASTDLRVAVAQLFANLVAAESTASSRRMRARGSGWMDSSSAMSGLISSFQAAISATAVSVLAVSLVTR